MSVTDWMSGGGRGRREEGEGGRRGKEGGRGRREEGEGRVKEVGIYTCMYLLQL